MLKIKRNRVDKKKKRSKKKKYSKKELDLYTINTVAEELVSSKIIARQQGNGQLATCC